MGLLRLAQQVLEVAPESSVIDAVKLMTDRNVGAVLVTRGRKIAGMFTERDLMRRVVAAGKDPATTLIEEVMTSPVFTVMDDTPIARALDRMRQQHIRHLAVLDTAGEPVGMLALRYLLYELMGELEHKVDDLEGYIMTDGPGG